MIGWIDNDSPGKSLMERISWAIRKAILSGQLRPSQKMPSTRELQQMLSVSRSTIIEVFEQLIVEGYLTSRKGSGTFVSEELPESRMLVTPQAKNGKLAVPRINPAPEWNSAPEMSAIELLSGKTLPFRPGVGAIDLFPTELWSKLINRRLSNSSLQSLGYGHPSGIWRLREQIASHISTTRGGDIRPEQVLVTSGAQQAVQLALTLVLKPGQSAFIEEPGYFCARSALLQRGATIKPLPVDKEGAVVPSSKDNKALVFLTPSFQYPLGIEMSLQRRLEILDWAARSQSWIIEDDYDCEFRYHGRPTPSLFALSNQSNVLYCLSFSKSLAPSLRLGCLVVPLSLAEDANRHLLILGRGAPTFEQEVFADFLETGKFKRQMRIAREVLAKRRSALIKALRPLDLEIISGQNGLHVTALWKSKDLAMSRKAMEAGLHLVPLSSLYLKQDKSQTGFLLGFGAFSEARIREAAVKLGKLLSS